MKSVGRETIECLRVILRCSESKDQRWWSCLGSCEKTFLVRAMRMPDEWASMTWEELTDQGQMDLIKALDLSTRVAASWAHLSDIRR